jgi:hypothetical protein
LAQELREQAQHCLYQRFQQTAAALTQVYQGQVKIRFPQATNMISETNKYNLQVSEGRDWQPFQTAAGSLTLLYKDSLEELRKAAEINRKLVRELSPGWRKTDSTSCQHQKFWSRIL